MPSPARSLSISSRCSLAAMIFLIVSVLPPWSNDSPTPERDCRRTICCAQSRLASSSRERLSNSASKSTTCFFWDSSSHSRGDPDDYLRRTLARARSFPFPQGQPCVWLMTEPPPQQPTALARTPPAGGNRAPSAVASGYRPSR